MSGKYRYPWWTRLFYALAYDLRQPRPEIFQKAETGRPMNAVPAWVTIVNEELDRLHAEFTPGQDYPTLEQLHAYCQRLDERLRAIAAHAAPDRA